MDVPIAPYTERNAHIFITRAWANTRLRDPTKGFLNPAQLTYQARGAFFTFFGLRNHFQNEYPEPPDNDESPFDISIPVLRAVGYASEIGPFGSMQSTSGPQFEDMRVGASALSNQVSSLSESMSPPPVEGLVKKIHALFRPTKRRGMINRAEQVVNGAAKRTASSAFASPRRAILPVFPDSQTSSEDSSITTIHHRDKRIKRESSSDLLSSAPQLPKPATSAGSSRQATVNLPGPSIVHKIPQKLWPVACFFQPYFYHEVDDLIVPKEFSQSLFASRSIVLNVALVRYIYFDPNDTYDNQRRIWLTGPKEAVEAAKIAFLTLLEQLKTEQRMKYDEYLRREVKVKEEDIERDERRREVNDRIREVDRDRGNNWRLSSDSWRRRDDRR